MTISRHIVLGQRSEGVGRVPLTGTSGYQLPVLLLGAVLASRAAVEQRPLRIAAALTCLLNGIAAAGWSFVGKAAFLVVQGLLKCCFHVKGSPRIDVSFNKKEVLLAGKTQFLSFR